MPHRRGLPLSVLLPFRLLRSNRNLRHLWLGETISYFGDNFYSIAIMWYVFQQTGSGLQTGLVLVSSFVPQVIAGPLLGTLSDRWNRKAMMRSASMIQALLTGLLATLVYVRAIDMPLIYGITIALSVVELAYSPARAGMFPDLVEAPDLMAGNALFSTSQQVARIVGSTLGGTFVALAGVSAAVGFDAITFLASAAYLQRVMHAPAIEPEPEGRRPSVLVDMRGGWAWLWEHKALLVLIGIATISNIALGPTNVLAPMLIRRVMHAGAGALGLFDSSIGFGLLVGGLVMGAVSPRKVGLLFAFGIGLEGLAMGIVAASPSLLLAYAGNFVLGLAVIVANLPSATLFQTLVPSALRGRIGSIAGMLSSVAIPITYGGVGILGDAVGARWSYGLGAILLAAGMAAGMSTSSLRTLSLDGVQPVGRVTEPG